MVDRITDNKDKFINFRDAESWASLRPIVASGFSGGVIPQEFEPHLNEWGNLRLKIQNHELSITEINHLTAEFGDAHLTLLNDSQFSWAIRAINKQTSTAG